MSIGDINSDKRGSGARFNAGKAPMELVPLSALEDCARVFGYGREKYAAWNWAKGMDWSVAYACLLRHMSAWFNGEDNDPESGLPHLGHAMCNLVMLSTFARTYPEGDDRPAQWLSGPEPRYTLKLDVDGTIKGGPNPHYIDGEKFVGAVCSGHVACQSGEVVDE